MEHQQCIPDDDDDCDLRCGEVFLTMKGDIIFHCVLCGNKYKGFQEYSLHTIKEHYASEINESGNSIDDADDSLIPEVVYSIDNAEETSQQQSSISFKIEVDYEKNPQAKEIQKANVETPRVHTCQQCGATFRHYTNLLGHLKRHSTNKPHNCTYCSKSFYTRPELRKHTRRHTNERPFLCSECGQKFTTSSELSTHFQRHTNERKKQCSICELRFFNNTALTHHMAVHTENRPHKCNVCDASFKLKKTLKTHEKIHENKRSYLCELCPAKFNQKPGLHSHMKSKHSIVPVTVTVRQGI